VDLSTQMLLFARVVKSGSFSAAARSVSHSPSAVSKQIKQLEDRLGVRLLTRTQHGITVTPEGRLFHERCEEISAAILDAEAQVTALGGSPQGELRVAATVAFAKAQLLPLLPAYLDANPNLRLSLELTDRVVDLAGEGFDVAIRFSEQVEDPSLVARRIAVNRRVICAAPGYLERCGRPTSWEELSRHNCLRLSTVESWNEWGVEGGRPVPVHGNLEANSADALYHATLAGLGVARLSTYMVSRDLRAGRLVQLLPAYTDEASDILAVYADRRHLSPKIRTFVDFLVASFGPVPPWEREETDAAAPAGDAASQERVAAAGV